MIKRIIPVCAALIFLLSYSSCRIIENGCGYDLDPSIKAPDSEIVRLENYIKANSITAVKHPSGLFYTVETEGFGNSPGQCSQVGVTYIGKLTNGTEFDRSDATKYFPLNTLVYCWRIALPLTKKGGKVRIYSPPYFGYGQQDRPKIPRNSILIFDVSLKEVN